MVEVVTVGLDIAKSVFQVHGVDVGGGVAIRRRLRRAQVLPFFAKLPACLIGIEACATAHYWAREISRVGPPGEAHTAQLCEAICKAAEERCS